MNNQTNFAALTQDQKQVWSRQLWKETREKMFLNKFMGGSMGIVHRVTELTKTEKGDKAILHLLADLKGDGVAGDQAREGAEEAMKAYTDEIRIDLLSHGVKEKGKMANQRTIVSMREHARDHLSYWLARRLDDMAILSLSGISFTKHLNGADRVESTLNQLSFAADVRAPSARRHLRIDSTGALQSGNTAALTANDKITYNALVDLCAYAETEYMRPLGEGGKEYYVLIMHPKAYAQLKKDSDFQNAIINAGPRDLNKNPWFTGGIVTIDGLVIHTTRLAYDTSGAASGSKWGATGTIDGTRTLLVGAQALAMADLGSPEWSEKMFEYDSQFGINVDKMVGFVKPRYQNYYSETVEDYGVIAIDHALNG